MKATTAHLAAIVALPALDAKAAKARRRTNELAVTCSVCGSRVQQAHTGRMREHCAGACKRSTRRWPASRTTSPRCWPSRPRPP